MPENLYYHWFPGTKRNGEIIEAGGYGKLVNELDRFFQQSKYIQEIMFEHFRLIYFPSKPSRFRSIFLLGSQEDAMLYKRHVELQTKQPYTRKLYKVQIIQEDARVHIGSTSLFNQYCLQGNYQKAAECYWHSTAASLELGNGVTEAFPQELVTESNVKVLYEIPLIEH